MAGADDITTEREYEAFLSERFGVPMRVVFGRSRTSPVQARTYRPRGSAHAGWEVRLHRMFAGAPDDVRDALAKWLKNGRRSRAAADRLDAWIHAALAELPPRHRTIRLAPRGRAYDLGALSAPLFADEFAADFAPSADVERPHVTWGRRSPSRSRRSLRLGSFEPESRVVRIHPVLDQPGVPDWFVRFVLKHEILHAVIPSYRDDAGRWVHHPPEFRERERSWPEYEPAVEWERRNLTKLIRSAREGGSPQAWK